MIFIHQGLNDTISRRTRNPIYPKNFGLLLGSKIKRGNQYIIHINEAIPLDRIKPHKNPRALSSKKWNDIQNKVYNRHPSMEVVGWYGVRNGWSAMLTEQDQRIHREFFTKSWQVIYLLDGSDGSNSFFYWDRDKLKQCNGYYQYYDENPRQTRLGSFKNKRLLITGSMVILAVVFIVLLYQQLGKQYFIPNYNKSTIGSIDESGIDDNQTVDSSHKEHQGDQDNSTPDKATQDKLNQRIEEYGVKIAQLERELGEKEQEIEALDQKVQQQELDRQSNQDHLIDGTIYIIQRGDNLYKISENFYDTDKYAKALAKVNRIKDQRSLTIGDYLVIPSIEEIENIR